MKVKVDENLPSRLVVWLREQGHDVQTVPDEGLTGHADAGVWSAAGREGRFLITQDLDFSDVRKYAPGSHAGLLLIRLREPGAGALAERVKAALRTTSLESMARCLAVLTDHKLRIRRN
jgi:predicted nuclease of predicted toxin-antitoxin system